MLRYLDGWMENSRRNRNIKIEQLDANGCTYATLVRYKPFVPEPVWDELETYLIKQITTMGASARKISQWVDYLHAIRGARITGHEMEVFDRVCKSYANTSDDDVNKYVFYNTLPRVAYGKIINLTSIREVPAEVNSTFILEKLKFND